MVPLKEVCVCAPPFFNVYTSDMLTTKSRKFGYADDLGLTCPVIKLEEIEKIFESDETLL